MTLPKQKRRMDRRHFIRASTVGAALIGGSVQLSGVEDKAAPGAADAASAPTKVHTNAQPGAVSTGSVHRVTPGCMPCGRIKGLTISRIISGGNIISGWCHSRDLLYVRRLAEQYLTTEKQHDTLQFLEELGVNTIVLDMVQMDIIKRYKTERGGQIQTLVAIRPDWGNWGKPTWEDLKTQIEQTMAQGPQALFVHGGFGDRMVQSSQPKQLELIGKALEFIREQGYAAGLGAHALEVPMTCDRLGMIPDFYFKTLHHDQYWSATPKDRRKRFCVDGAKHLDHNEFHDNIFCIDPEETIAFMRTKKEPWIAFKVLAGGAINPPSGFKYAFENGADFLAVGMFDFEAKEDIQIAKSMLPSLKRDRPWMA
jgi:hypothetical protein